MQMKDVSKEKIYIFIELKMLQSKCGAIQLLWKNEYDWL